MILVIFIELIVAFTPVFTAFIMFRFRNQVRDRKILDKFGSLYEEFKLDKGFMSQIFYLVYLVRRLQYMLSQVLLDDYIYLQYSLNLSFTIFQFAYLVYYRPFKEKYIMISEFIGQVTVVIIFILTGLMLPSKLEFSSSTTDTIFIYVVIICISSQTIIGFFSFYLMAKQIYLKAKKYKLEKNIKISQKVFPETFDASISDCDGMKTFNTDILV